jgi:hypothetical protein
MSIALRSPALNSLSEVRDGLLPGFQWCLRITGKLRFARATHPGRAEAPEGRDPSRPYPLPGVWGCPTTCHSRGSGNPGSIDSLAAARSLARRAIQLSRGQVGGLTLTGQPHRK